MDRRLKLCLGVSACALLGAVTLPLPSFAGMHGGGGGQGNAQDHHGLDPNGGFQHECGEPGGCAEAGETFETESAQELGEDAQSLHQHPLVTPSQPMSGNGGLSGGDSVSGRLNGGSLGGGGGGLGN